MSLVSLVKMNGDAVASFKKAISQSLDLINCKFGNEIKTVVIKPNLCYYWDYTTGQTTDPRFVTALIELLRDRISCDTSISIVESDASAMKCKYSFRMLGYEKLSQDLGVKLVNLSQVEGKRTELVSKGKAFCFTIPRIIQEADLKINVPKIKYTMRGIELTCALKNIFGCNPYQKKFRYHSQLGETIVAINKAIKFDFSIIDGNVVSGIQPRRLGLVVASEDPVAIDCAAAKIAGLNPRKIRYLQLARKEGLGSTSFTPKGESIAFFKSRYPKRNVNKILMGKAYGMVTLLGIGSRIGLE